MVVFSILFESDDLLPGKYILEDKEMCSVYTTFEDGQNMGVIAKGDIVLLDRFVMGGKQKELIMGHIAGLELSSGRDLSEFIGYWITVKTHRKDNKTNTQFMLKYIGPDIEEGKNEVSVTNNCEIKEINTHTCTRQKNVEPAKRFVCKISEQP